MYHISWIVQSPNDPVLKSAVGELCAWLLVTSNLAETVQVIVTAVELKTAFASIKEEKLVQDRKREKTHRY